MTKKISFFVLSFLFALFLPLNIIATTYSAEPTPTPQPEATSGNFCNLTPAGASTGDVVLSNDCVVYENINGVANGNLTITSTITLHHDLVFYPNYQINIQGVVFINTGSKIQQGKICIKDADADGYADLIPLAVDPVTGAPLTGSSLTQIQSEIVIDSPYTCSAGFVSRENFSNLALVDSGTNPDVYATGDNIFLQLGFEINGVRDLNAAAGDIILPNTKNLILLPGGIGGKIGVGTTTPTAKLTIKQETSGFESGIVLTDSVGTLGSLWMGSSNNILNIGNEDNSLDIHFNDSVLAVNGTSGFVGIGKTNPQTQMDVSGSINSSSNYLINGEVFAARNGADLRLGDFNDGGWNVEMWSGNNQTMTLNSSGNVGIGTTTPSQKLEVKGQLLINTLTADGGELGLASTGQHSWFLDNYSGRLRFLNNGEKISFYGNGGSSYGLTYASTTPPASGMIIEGNVGIGKTNPADKLDINGNVSINGIVRCINTNCPANGVVRLTPNLHFNSLAGNAIIVNWDNGTTGNVQTFRVGNGAGADAFYVNANGNTVINGNLSIPVVASSWITGKTGTQGITSTTALSGGYSPLIRQTTQSGHVVNLGGLGNDWGFFGYTSSRTANGFDYSMIMDLTNGNIGINTLDPTYKLQVIGSFYAGGSSRDYKKNIIPMTLDSSKIYELEPMTYDYRDEYKHLGKTLSGGRQFGLIAEDVYKVYPELTLNDGVKNVANVDYEKLGVLLLAEMKNQKKEIDSLKAKNIELEKRIEKIEQLLK